MLATKAAVGVALFHFIDGDDDQQPAVSGAQLKQWLAQGLVNETTSVWADDGSMEDWVTLRQAGPLYAYCTEIEVAGLQPVGGGQGGKDGQPAGKPLLTGPAAVSAPAAAGKPPVFFIHDSDVEAERKYEKKRKTAKAVATTSAILLAVTAGATLWFGSGLLDDGSNQSCGVPDTPFLHVVYGWLLVFSLLLLAAELGSTKLRTYVHFLAYRTGRAGMGLFCGSLVLASALCVEESNSNSYQHGYSNGYQQASNNYNNNNYNNNKNQNNNGYNNGYQPQGAIESGLSSLGRLQWKPLLVGLVVVGAAVFNLLVTKRGKKIGRSKDHSKDKETAEPTTLL